MNLSATLSSDDCFSLPPLPSLTGWPRGSQGAELSLTGQRGKAAPPAWNFLPGSGLLFPHPILSSPPHPIFLCSSISCSHKYWRASCQTLPCQLPQLHTSRPGLGGLSVTLRSHLDCAPGTVTGDTSPIAHSHREHLGQHQAPNRASCAWNAQLFSCPSCPKPLSWAGYGDPGQQPTSQRSQI